MTSAKEELNFEFYLILINLNLSSHMPLMTTALGNSASGTTLKKSRPQLCTITWGGFTQQEKLDPRNAWNMMTFMKSSKIGKTILNVHDEKLNHGV